VGGRHGRRWLARAVGLALLLQFLFTPSAAEALSWHLPGRERAPSSLPSGTQAGRQLQEVAPPAWVQKARESLEERDPTVRILAPADDDLLPDGPWTLRLQVSDWPLVEAGSLGLGPHLVVQLDGEPARPTVETEVEMPPLSPGSHLLTVYAAKPWGEAHKSPLALQQIRIHRLAPNPATLPAPGTPQLIPVSPAGPTGAPPLPLDWLLIDAPLQGLRGDASGWRLRLTLNGESVLVDQQMPLWLQGWKQGSNALLLELLDGRGQSLNPPFNSLLREVIVPEASAPGSAPALSSPRTDLELAVLLGDQPVSALIPATPEAAAPAKAPSFKEEGAGAFRHARLPPSTNPLSEPIPASPSPLAPQTSLADPAAAAPSTESRRASSSSLAPPPESRSPSLPRLPAAPETPPIPETASRTAESTATAPVPATQGLPAAPFPAPIAPRPEAQAPFPPPMAPSAPPVASTPEHPEPLAAASPPEPRVAARPAEPLVAAASSQPRTAAGPPEPVAAAASPEPPSTAQPARLSQPPPEPAAAAAAKPGAPSAASPAGGAINPPVAVLDDQWPAPPDAGPPATADRPLSARLEGDPDGTLRSPSVPNLLERLRERLAR